MGRHLPSPAIVATVDAVPDAISPANNLPASAALLELSLPTARTIHFATSVHQGSSARIQKRRPRHGAPLTTFLNLGLPHATIAALLMLMDCSAQASPFLQNQPRQEHS